MFFQCPMKINVEGCNIFRVFSVKNIRRNSSMLCLECHLLNNKPFAQYPYLGTVSAKIGVSPPPECPYIGLPTIYQLILKKQNHGLSQMYSSGYFILSNDSNWKLICIISIFEVILVKILVFDPLGRTYIYRVVVSNAQNRKVLWIIPIFAVIFGQNVKFWPPGVSPYRVTPHCYGIYLEEI